MKHSDPLRKTKQLVNNGRSFSCKYTTNALSDRQSDILNKMEISACQDWGKSRRERVRETKRGIWKEKKKSPWEKWETVVPLGCIMVTFFIFTSDYNLSTKWLLHWIWIHVNFWHRLCVTSSRRYKFDFPPSLVYTFYCHTKKFAFLLPVAAYAFFFLTNVQNLYPDLHVKTQPKQQKRTSWAHTSYFYDGF